MRKDQILEQQINEVRVSSTIQGLERTIATLRAKLTQVEQDRDRLAAEYERLKHADAIGYDRYQLGVKVGLKQTESQLAAAQEENKRLKEDCFHLKQALEFKNIALTAAQQSAQEQYRKGMERACCLIEQFVAKTCQSGHLLKVRDQIRAELSKGKGNEQGL